MPRWLNVTLGLVGIALVPVILIARVHRYVEGPSVVRAGMMGAVAVVVLGAVIFVSRRYGDPEE